MKKIPFIKYSSYGNNFIIIDEINSPILTEYEKSSCACRATNVNFGIGSDGFIVLQPCTPKVISKIQANRRYWKKSPDSKNAEYILRMFEPNGKESSSCGNGLLCITDYLHQQYGIKSARILTEIPTSDPQVISIGNLDEKTSWINTGHPRQIPPEMIDLSIIASDDNIMTVKDINIRFRNNGVDFFRGEVLVTLSGYLVFTGEPHLVIFTETDIHPNQLADTIFISSCSENPGIENTENKINFSSRLIHYIGTYLNKNYSHYFPAGININFVRVLDASGVLEYRCFERGINMETHACGTGAVAVSCIARKLNLIQSNHAIVLPYLCRRHDPNAQIHVKEIQNKYILYGTPVLLCEGVFMLRDIFN